MEINEIFSFPYDSGKREKETCVNSSGMNTMFDIPHNLRLSVKFSTHMINNAREKIGFSCTNYFRPIFVLVFDLITTLNKFCFHSRRNKKISLVLVSLRFSIAILHQ